MAFGIVFFPLSWRFGPWDRPKKFIFSVGPVRFVWYKQPGKWKPLNPLDPVDPREEAIAEAVRTGTPCQPSTTGVDGDETTPYCQVCYRGPCYGGPRQ
jgi:hypothetical protein